MILAMDQSYGPRRSGLPSVSGLGQWFARHKVLTVSQAIILLVIIASVAGGGGKKNAANPLTPAIAPTTAAAAADKSPERAPSPAGPIPTAPPTAPPTTAAPQVAFSQSGTGLQMLAPFSILGPWVLQYTFDCSNFGIAGDFAVQVTNANGTPNLIDNGPNVVAMNANASTFMPQGGTLSLTIDTECNWTIQAVNTP